MENSPNLSTPDIHDKITRLSTLYKIRDKNKKLTLLKPNDIQRAMYESIKGMDPIRYFVLKYRQGGVSTFWLLWWLDETIFKRNTVSGILSHKKESLNYLWEIIRIAFKSMPDKLKPRVEEDSKSVLSFPDINSKIFVSLGIRSTAVHNLHISEWAFCDDDDIRATLGATGPNANITGETTGNGIGNDAYMTYQDGKLGENGFKVDFFPWHMQSEYRIPTMGVKVIKTPEEQKLGIDDEQVMFRRNKRKSLKEMFPQEYPEDDQTAFLTTGNPFFNGRKIQALMAEARDVPKVMDAYDYVQWEEPNKYDVYASGADVAEGISGDFSVLTIINVTKRRTAFRYKARVGVDTFARVCDEWGRKFNKALLAVERNNHGHAVIMELVRLKYPNLFTQDQETRVVKTNGLQERKTIVKYGWETTRLTKPIMLDHLKMGIEGDDMEDVDNFTPEIMVLDIEFLKECFTIVNDNGIIGAQSAKHDDIVIATAIAFQMYMKLKRRASRRPSEGIYIGDKYQVDAII